MLDVASILSVSNTHATPPECLVVLPAGVAAHDGGRQRAIVEGVLEIEKDFCKYCFCARSQQCVHVIASTRRGDSAGHIPNPFGALGLLSSTNAIVICLRDEQIAI